MNEFFRCVLGSNPFDGTPARESTAAAIHVRGIHIRQFQELVACCHSTRKDALARPVLIWGEAGIGKSHLLIQFSRWANQEKRLQHHLFRALPVVPEKLPKYVVRSVLQQMTRDHRRGPGSTELGRLVRTVVELALGEHVSQSQLSTERARRTLCRFVESRWQGEEVPAGAGAACDILLRFSAARDNRRAIPALRWLAGDASGPLPRPATPETIVALLSQLSAFAGRVMVFSFDQLERWNDEQQEALAAWCDRLAASAPALLTVLAGQRQCLEERIEQGGAEQTTWGRLSRNRHVLELNRVSRDQARRVLEKRLRRFVEPFLTMAPIREQGERDSLFPLGSDWFREQSENRSSFCPREIIVWAAERWQRQQALLHELGGPAWLQHARHDPSTAMALTTTDSLGKSDTATRELTVRQVNVPAQRVPQLSRKEVVRTRQPSTMHERGVSSPTRKQKTLELVAWAVTTVNLAALVVATAGAPAGLMARFTALAEARRNSEPPNATTQPYDGEASFPEATKGSGTSRTREPDAHPVSAADESAPEISRSPAESVDGGDGQPRDRLITPADRSTAGPDRGGEGRQPPHRQVAASGTSARAPTPRDKPANRIASVTPVSGASGGELPRTPPPATTVDRITTSASRPSATDARPDNGRDAAGSVRSRADRFTQADRLAARLKQEKREDPSQVRPADIVADPDIDRLIAEAWGLFNRGDYGPGQLRLNEARRLNRDDPRALFSLGLLAAVVSQDWRAAEEHFGDCVRLDPENVPSLNNLAVALVLNQDVDAALRHWKTIVKQGGATTEVVQNLGCVRFIAEQDYIRAKNSLLKTLESLYTDAAVATNASFDIKTGFHLMPLVLPDGSMLGWADAGKLRGPSLAPKEKPDAASPMSPPRSRESESPAPQVTPAMPVSGEQRPGLDPKQAGYPYYPSANGPLWRGRR